MSTTKILVVDDSHTIRIQLERILKSAGYEVITASDGNQAIEMMLDQSPSLMVLDVKMPTLDGYGVCEKLNQLGPRINRPPVVFLTSLQSKALELLGHEFGAYLHKPVRGDELLQVVEQQIAHSSKRESPATSAR